MPNGISLRIEESARRRLFSLVLERSKWCSNNWTEGIKHYYSQLWFGHTVREDASGGQPNRNLHNNFKIDPNVPLVSSVPSWLNTLTVVVIRTEPPSIRRHLPSVAIYFDEIGKWKRWTYCHRYATSAFKCNFILTKNYAYNKLPFLWHRTSFVHHRRLSP